MIRLPWRRTAARPLDWDTAETLFGLGELTARWLLGEDSTAFVPVTRDGDRIHTGIHATMPLKHLSFLLDVLPRAGQAAVRSATYLAVIDPVWGRMDYLWPALSTALAAVTSVGAAR